MAQLHPPYIVKATAETVRERMNDRKKFVFQLNLIWSDHSQSTSYRSYSEFFDFQCDLLAQFPREAGSVKGHERIIPYLPGKKVFQRSDRRLAESRLAQIDCYMREFVQLPDHVVKCESACRFFRSNWPEDKAKNGENAPLVSNVRYTVRTMSRDHLLDAEDGSREGSVDPLSPTHSDSPSGGDFVLSDGKISGI